MSPLSFSGVHDPRFFRHLGASDVAAIGARTGIELHNYFVDPSRGLSVARSIEALTGTATYDRFPVLTFNLDPA
jgi:hypothetical protein